MAIPLLALLAVGVNAGLMAKAFGTAKKRRAITLEDINEQRRASSDALRAIGAGAPTGLEGTGADARGTAAGALRPETQAALQRQLEGATTQAEFDKVLARGAAFSVRNRAVARSAEAHTLALASESRQAENHANSQADRLQAQADKASGTDIFRLNQEAQVKKGRHAVEDPQNPGLIAYIPNFKTPEWEEKITALSNQEGALRMANEFEAMLADAAASGNPIGSFQGDPRVARASALSKGLILAGRRAEEGSGPLDEGMIRIFEAMLPDATNFWQRLISTPEAMLNRIKPFTQRLEQSFAIAQEGARLLEGKPGFVVEAAATTAAKRDLLNRVFTPRALQAAEQRTQAIIQAGTAVPANKPFAAPTFARMAVDALVGDEFFLTPEQAKARKALENLEASRAAALSLDRLLGTQIGRLIDQR